MKGEEIYIIGDQPTTCPMFGNRTEITEELSDNTEMQQTHQCPSDYCQYTFTVVEN